MMFEHGGWLGSLSRGGRSRHGCRSRGRSRHCSRGWCRGSSDGSRSGGRRSCDGSRHGCCGCVVFHFRFDITENSRRTGFRSQADPDVPGCTVDRKIFFETLFLSVKRAELPV